MQIDRSFTTARARARRFAAVSAVVATLLAPALHAATDVLAQAEEKARALVAQMTLDEKVEQLLNTAPAIPRLGIPAYNWWTESLHGALGPVPTTNFPEPIGLAATFDEALLHDVAAAISAEVRALHALGRKTGGSAASVRVSTLGRPTSTSSAIRVGDAGRRPTAKILSSRRAWVLRTCAACKGRIPSSRT